VLVNLYTDKISWRIKMEIIGGLLTFIVGTCLSGLICLLPLIVIGVVGLTVMGAINGAMTGRR